MVKSALATLTALLAVALVSSIRQPEVTIAQGIVKGLYDKATEGREVSLFWGIPYARPPVGKHRFKESIPALPWIGEYNATKIPPACLQYSHFTYKTEFGIFGSEDCLYINVFTPKVLQSGEEGKLLDVIVFIHGGAFMFFQGAGFLPHLLLNRDVVLVTLNYRLGPLGFLSTEDSVVPGNNGLKDQLLALKWVQANIAAFGGNPNSVTLGGLSAGSASTHYHLLSPLSKGLFHGAILQSGAAINPWAYAENPKEKTQYIGEQLGCPTNDSLLLVKCLRNRPAEHIVELSKDFMKFLYNPFSPFAPSIEPPSPTAFISDTPMNIINQGLANDVPMIISYAKAEGIYPGAEIVGQEENLKALKENWNDHLPYILDYHRLPQERHHEISSKIKEHYKIDLDQTEGLHNFISVVSDRLFLHGIVKSLRSHGTQNTSPIYVYRFSFRGTHSLNDFFTKMDFGVSHADDTYYIMNPLMGNWIETDEEKHLSNKMIDFWVAFAANRSLPSPWQPIQESLPEISFVDISGPDNFNLVSTSSIGEEEFWESLAAEELMSDQPAIIHTEL